MGGARFWVDPAHEIVGIYLGVVTRFHPRLQLPITELPLFQNMLTAAVAD